jgi:single-stranded DNA-binding protein
MNECVFIGRIGKKPEKRYLASGKSMVTFGLAVDEQKPNGAEKSTTWVDCVAFGDRADKIAAALDKGQLVKVRASYSKVKKADKVYHSFTVWEFEVVGKGKPKAQPAYDEEADEEMPF